MSRLGKVPLKVPDKVKVAVADDKVAVDGPKGKLSEPLLPGVQVTVEDRGILVGRTTEGRAERSAQGLMRRLVSNMIEGVSTGFSRSLEITGVGYRAESRGDQVHLSLGYSHPIVYQLPEGVKASVDKQTVITVTGIDRQLVGEVAAGLRKLRPPEPYKGKGIRYADEHIRRKAGKAGAAAK